RAPREGALRAAPRRRSTASAAGRDRARGGPRSAHREARAQGVEAPTVSGSPAPADEPRPESRLERRLRRWLHATGAPTARARRHVRDEPTSTEAIRSRRRPEAEESRGDTMMRGRSGARATIEGSSTIDRSSVDGSRERGRSGDPVIANASGRRVVEPGEFAGRFLRQPIAEDGILVWRETWSAGDASGGGSFETLFGDRLGPRELLRALDRRGHDPRSLAFLDIETCGLGDLPIFLLGLLSFSGDRWELLQAFAPEPGKERRVLRRAIDVLVSRPVWVTFNGRSFDVPRL